MAGIGQLPAVRRGVEEGGAIEPVTLLVVVLGGQDALGAILDVVVRSVWVFS
jgi:hypothetical protein